MKTCGSCGSALGEADRFCGECGTAVPEEVAPSTAAGSRPTEPEAANPAEGRSKAVFYAGAALGALLLFGAGYYLPSTISGSPPEDSEPRLPPEGGAPPAEPPGKPGVQARFEAAQEAREGEAEATSDTRRDDEPDSPAEPAKAAPPIEPGNWTFRNELFNITKVDLSDFSFELNRQGIGQSQTDTMCITPSVARDPAATGFPYSARRQCRSVSLTMRDNRYRGRMTCYFDDYGGRYPVDVEGTYSETDIAIELRVRVPAQIVSGDFERPPDVYMYYLVEGRRTGGC